VSSSFFLLRSPNVIPTFREETVELFVAQGGIFHGRRERSADLLKRLGPRNFFPDGLCDECAYVLTASRSSQPQGVFHFRRKINV
jgi:hypothetical protein